VDLLKRVRMRSVVARMVKPNVPLGTSSRLGSVSFTAGGQPHVGLPASNRRRKRSFLACAGREPVAGALGSGHRRPIPYQYCMQEPDVQRRQWRV